MSKLFNFAILTAMSFALMASPYWWMVFVVMPFLWAHYLQ